MNIIHYQATKFDYVLFVAGNHEYYNANDTKHTISEQYEWMKDICSKRENVIFVERSCVEINDTNTVILGTTLWSKVSRSNEARAQMAMNDYHLSYMMNEADEEKQQQKLTVQCTNFQFYRNLNWLEEQINKYTTQKKDIIILTHHTPVMNGTSNPIYGTDNELSGCFSTDLTRLLKHPIKYWACGHTHWNFDMTFDNGNTRLVSNQRGYPGKEKEDYNNGGVLLRITSSAHSVIEHLI